MWFLQPKSRTYRFLIFVQSFILLSLIGVPAQTKEASKAKRKNVLIFQQVNQTLGPMTLYLADDAAKFVALKGEFSITAKAPTWRVVAYSHSQNKGMELSLDQWTLSSGLGLMGSHIKFIRGTRSVVKDPILKMDCLLVQTRGTPEKEYAGSDEPLLFRSAKKKEVVKNRYKCTTSVAVRSEAQKFLSGIYSQDEFGGVPLELARDFSDGSVETTYFTTAASNTKINDDFFVYPKGFNKAPGMKELLITKKQEANLKDYFDVLLAPDSTTNSNKKPPH